jgi:hypothetical protein
MGCAELAQALGQGSAAYAALSEDAALALIRGLGARSGFGDDWLRLWGLKFVMDGGVEGGARRVRRDRAVPAAVEHGQRDAHRLGT